MTYDAPPDDVSPTDTELARVAVRIVDRIAKAPAGSLNKLHAAGLREICRLFGLTNCHICRIHGQRPQRITMLCESRASGHGTLRKHFQHLPLPICSHFLKPLQENRCATIGDVLRLPDSARTLRCVLLSRDIRLYSVIPLVIRNRLWGFLGCCRSTPSPDGDPQDDFSRARIIGEILANSLNQRRARRRLVRSCREWRSLAAAGHEFVVTLDENRRIKKVLRAIPGMIHRQMIGASVYEFIDRRHYRRTREAFKQVDATGTDETFEHEAIGPHGTSIWYRTRIVPSRPVSSRSGDVSGQMMMFSTNIHDLKLAESRIQQLNQELDFAKRLNLLAFVSGQIAHDLGQPLQVIKSSADRCRKIIGDAPDSRTEQALGSTLDEITDATETASGIINSIKAFVRKKKHEPQFVSADFVIDKAVKMTRELFRDANIDLELKIASGLPQLCIDEFAITVVMMNLLINSVDALSRTTGRPRRVTLTAALNDRHYIAIVVSDNGPGIAPDDREHVFERFYSTRKTGLGMGLALARDILTAHDGHIWFTSDQEKGCEFHITLPVGSTIGADTAELPIVVVERADDDGTPSP